MKPEDLLTKLQWRYAVKKFDPDKKIDPITWNAIEDSLILTPSSYGLQPWKFIVVEDPEMKKTLRSFSWGQSQVEDCSHFVVMLARESTTEADIDKYLERLSQVQGTPIEGLTKLKKVMIGDLIAGPRGQIISEWAARQVYIALGQAMTVAATLNVDACPMEGIDPVKFDSILNIEDQSYKTLVALAFGYRSSEDRFSKMKKVRFDKSDIIERR